MLHVMWFRRDLRLADNPALLAALASARAAGAAGILALYIVDPDEVAATGRAQLGYLAASLRALSEDLGGLHVRVGEPAAVLGELAAAHDGIQVHHAAEFTPHAISRDTRVATALAGRGELVTTGSPYAVAPGRVRKSDGTRYQVFTPYHRAWLAHGWRAPAPAPESVPLLRVAGSEGLPSWDYPVGMTPRPTAAGQAAAAERWATFCRDSLIDYPHDRDRPDRDGTSLMSTPLRFGEIHPRTLLAELAGIMAAPGGNPAMPPGPRAAEPGDQPVAAAGSVMRELAWREFFADVLAHRPDTVSANLNPSFDALPHDDGPTAAAGLAAWQAGCTGFPLVDAGMRELASTGLMHNRVRMVVASFLVKDLHLPWWLGAAHFANLLLDADLASNTHNWQWVAGCGADAAPYYRVFNPVTQAQKFDPDGHYVRTHVPELRHLPGRSAHTPWEAPGGYAHGYPARIVDHAEERIEALARYQSLRGPR